MPCDRGVPKIPREGCPGEEGAPPRRGLYREWLPFAALVGGSEGRSDCRWMNLSLERPTGSPGLSEPDQSLWYRWCLGETSRRLFGALRSLAR